MSVSAYVLPAEAAEGVKSTSRGCDVRAENWTQLSARTASALTIEPSLQLLNGIFKLFSVITIAFFLVFSSSFYALFTCLSWVTIAVFI